MSKTCRPLRNASLKLIRTSQNPVTVKDTSRSTPSIHLLFISVQTEVRASMYRPVGNREKRTPKGLGLDTSTTCTLTLILPRSRTGTVWFYTSTSNKRVVRPKLYTKSLTGDLKLMYSRFTLVRISIKL